MEKGTISILTTKSGKRIARVNFTKPDGSTAAIDVQFWQPTADEQKYDGTPCEFERQGGKLVRVITHDGRTFSSAPIASPQQSFKQHMGSTTTAGVVDSFDPAKTLLPKDTRQVLEKVNPDNFFLKWQKAARYEEDPRTGVGKFLFFKRDRKGDNVEIAPNFDGIDFAQLADRELANARALLGDNRIREVTFKTQWRMVQGLGLESVYETSMTLHHVYGIPYIPASALKGLVRSWIIDRAYDGKEDSALSDPRFCDWFGCPGEWIIEDDEGNRKRTASRDKKARKGALAFFDAYPLKAPTLQVDVMNPHYAPYYSDNSGQKPPADYYSPIPVFFLTVAETPFRFIVGSRNAEVLAQTLKGGGAIEDWLKSALLEHGVGAKTAVGYGYMTR